MPIAHVAALLRNNEASAGGRAIHDAIPVSGYICDVATGRLDAVVPAD
jgi:hypothetical protein